MTEKTHPRITGTPARNASNKQRRLSHLALALVVTALSTWMAAPASAHISLIDSSPRQGDHLEQLPEVVSFEFSDTIRKPAYVVVTAPNGLAVASGQPTVEGKTIRQALADGPDGGYTMAYQAVSEDGHPISGAITFSVGDAGTGGANTATEPPDPAGDELDATASTGGSARRQTGGDVADGDGPALSVVVAVALFGGAAVLFVLSRREPT